MRRSAQEPKDTFTSMSCENTDRSVTRVYLVLKYVCTSRINLSMYLKYR